MPTTGATEQSATVKTKKPPPQAKQTCEHGHADYCAFCAAERVPRCEHGHAGYCGHCGSVD